MNTLRLILGDQLTHCISSLVDTDHERDIILMSEVIDEATYVKHHKKKIAFIFSAMRHFANELEKKGYRLHYVKLDDVDNGGSFKSEVTRAIRTYSPDRVVVTEPGEYRVLRDLKSWQINVPVEILPDNRFLCSHSEFYEWAKGRKQLTMEYFYRQMRKKHDVLMNGNLPVGGKWNYDSENRNDPN